MANFALEPSIKPSKPLALTLGEPAGIGPDITIAAWLRRRELNLPAFYLLGDEAFVARRAKALGADIRIASVSAGEAAAAFTEALPVVATGESATAEPGKPDDASAPAALASIRQAVADVREGRAGAVVTTVAPAAGGGSAHRRCAPPAPHAGASCSSARAGASCGGAESGRARRAHAG